MLQGWCRVLSRRWDELPTKTVTGSRSSRRADSGAGESVRWRFSSGRPLAVLGLWAGVLVFAFAACSGSTPGTTEGLSPASTSSTVSGGTANPSTSVTTSSTFAVVEPTSIPPTSTSTTTTISPWVGIEPFGADNLLTDFREGSDTILDVLRALGYDSFEGDDSSATSESFQALSESGKVALQVSILWGVDEPPGAFDSPGLTQIGGRVVGTLTRVGGDPGIWLVCRGLLVEILPDGGFEQNEELLDTIIDQLGC